MPAEWTAEPDHARARSTCAGSNERLPRLPSHRSTREYRDHVQVADLWLGFWSAVAKRPVTPQPGGGGSDDTASGGLHGAGKAACPEHFREHFRGSHRSPNISGLSPWAKSVGKRAKPKVGG